MNTTTAQAILLRVERLEQQNRRLKRLGAGVLFLAAPVVLLGQRQLGTRTIQAEEFRVLDSTGATRATLGVEDGAVHLSFWDVEGAHRLLIYQEEDESGLVALDTTQSARFSLFADDDEVQLSFNGPDDRERIQLSEDRNGSGLFLGSSENQSQIGLFLFQDGESYLRFRDSDGTLRMRLEHIEDGAFMNIDDEARRTVIALEDRTSGPYLGLGSLWGSQGHLLLDVTDQGPRFGLFYADERPFSLFQLVYPPDNAGIWFFNHEGEVTWHAPPS
jgi:hypothetical protein